MPKGLLGVGVYRGSWMIRDGSSRESGVFSGPYHFFSGKDWKGKACLGSCCNYFWQSIETRAGLHAE